MADRNPKDEREEGLEPKTAQSGEDAVATDEREQDYGESGQFAPGGYYNQRGVTAPDRLTLDDDIKK